MKKLIISSVRFLVILLILLFIVKSWFGVNMPLLKKDTASQKILNQRLQLPEGFSLSVFADKLPGARMLLLTETGDLLVSLSKHGKIIVLHKGADADSFSDASRELISDLNLPHGMSFYQDWLYIAETDAVGRIRFDAKKGKTVGEYQRIITGLPEGGNHWSRSLHFGPDGMLYVSVGSSCNVCQEQDPRRAALLRFTPEGKQAEIFASGLRNTVGFDWHPTTHKLYGVDNGRDLLGDDFPPCELNHIEQDGFYGWPYVNGQQIPDPDFGDKAQLETSIAPVHAFAAHTAPLSLIFIKNAELRAAIKADALVALHGSWNSSKKVGYKIVSLQFDAENDIIESDFITGFEVNGNVIGRPVDIVEAPDGSLYISDDFTGSIYKVSYAAR